MPDWPEILSQDGPAAWRTAYRLLGNRADADECFQEACLAALEVSRREQVHNWHGLLQRLAVARSVDRLRVRKRARLQTSTSGLHQVQDGSLLPSQNVEDAELASALRLALARTPPRQAEAFCLHCVEDCSYQEIAQSLRISVDAVGVLIHRAWQHLRKLLARCYACRAEAKSRAASITKTDVAPESLRKERS
jgi:RNA polymerase sigma-70 factor (ECF subfamily)